MNIVRLNINPNMSDDNIKDVARKHPMNGEYTTKICKRCGMFWCAEDGNVETSIIVDKCAKCFDKTDEQVASIRK